jgi:hypothetical protein
LLVTWRRSEAGLWRGALWQVLLPRGSMGLRTCRLLGGAALVVGFAYFVAWPRAAVYREHQEEALWDALAEAESISGADMRAIPVVLFAGTRSEYLRKVLQDLDVERRVCIVSFNSLEDGQLAASFDVALHVQKLHVRAIRVQPFSHNHRRGHAYMKHVWMATMQRTRFCNIRVCVSQLLSCRSHGICFGALHRGVEHAGTLRRRCDIS